MNQQNDSMHKNLAESVDEEVDLIEVFKKIWAERKTIYITVGICFFIGIVIILGTPKSYVSQTKLLAEVSSKSGSGLGQLAGLAGMAGINLGGTSGAEALSVDLYPEIVKSTPFLIEVMSQKVTESKTNKTITVAEYLDEYTKPSLVAVIMSYTIGLPGKIIGAFNKKKEEGSLIPNISSGALKLTSKQAAIAGMLEKCISVKMDDGVESGSNILTVSIETQDPNVSAQMTDSVVACLKRYIINYHTGKAKKDLEFVTTQYNDAKAKFYTIQQTLATHKDQNLNIILASVNTSTERLQMEYTLASNVYNTLAQQFEQAKLKVQEHTPVFTVIEPATIPLKKNKPKSSLILIAMIFLGGFIGCCVIAGKSFLSKASQNQSESVTKDFV
jgi:LPS O-antigen subunit length determinant protein (WzzB/FepE family)